MDSLIILPGWLISNTKEEPQKGWALRIQGNEVSDLGPAVRILGKYPKDTILEVSNQILAPGFVNAHTHFYGVLAHGVPFERAPSEFWSFLNEFWWPLIEDRLDQEMICTATELRCVDMLRTGVTSFFNVTEAPNALPGILSEQASVVRRYGLRGVLSFEATERVSRANGHLGIRENVEFIKACRQAPDNLLSGVMCFHTTFTCSENFIKEIFALGRKLGVMVHMHCAESKYEPQYLLKNFDLRTLQYYDYLGVLDPNTVASQCVQIDRTEIELMAKSGVKMTHMPLSNCEVGGGIAPVPDLIASGVTVGLGSDGYIDDFFEVMRGAFLIHKAKSLNPQTMPAETVWYISTEGGARAIGLEKVGRLEPGWKADMQLIQGDFPTPLEAHNLYEQVLLYRNHTHVQTTIVNGEVRYQKDQLLDDSIESIYNRVRTEAKRLWNKGKLNV